MYNPVVSEKHRTGTGTVGAQKRFLMGTIIMITVSYSEQSSYTAMLNITESIPSNSR
jgi:hypothetical protein